MIGIFHQRRIFNACMLQHQQQPCSFNFFFFSLYLVGGVSLPSATTISSCILHLYKFSIIIHFQKNRQRQREWMKYKRKHLEFIHAYYSYRENFICCVGKLYSIIHSISRYRENVVIIMSIQDQATIVGVFKKKFELNIVALRLYCCCEKCFFFCIP